MGYYLSSRYKRYDNGGKLQAITGAGNVLASTIEGITGTDQYGRRPMGSQVLSGAASGASAGSAFGPLGTGIGAVLGAGFGLIGNISQNKAVEKQIRTERMNEAQTERARSAAVLGNNPELVYGYKDAQYFANGGMLSRKFLGADKLTNGSVTPLSNESVEVNGPSHEQGGVQLPAAGAELEGNETVHNDFVFSERLGFAKEHKILAKAIGKIESKKVMTPERVNAIKRLEERQENLKLSQEYLKSMMV